MGSIPASSSITIYMGFASSDTNLFNNKTTGEAPQLSPSYAEYDDGANVFNFYSDFKGTSLNTSKWTSSGAVSVDNGVTLGAGGVAGQINTISTSVVPSNMNLMGITYGTFNATTSSYSSMNYALNAPTASYITDLQGKSSLYFTYYASSTNVYGSGVTYSGTHTGLYTFNASNDDKLTMAVVGHGVASVSSSAVSPYGNFTARTGIGPEIINYIAIASLPPNSVMPSASFGSAETTLPYGEYDNGANVFNDYWNFEGTSTPSVFTVINPSGVTVNNGIYIAPQPNNYAGIQYNGVFSPNSVVEYDELNSYSVNGCWAVGEAVGSFNSSGGYIYVYNQGGSAPSPMGWSGGSIVISNGIAYNSIFNSVPRNIIEWIDDGFPEKIINLAVGRPVNKASV